MDKKPSSDKLIFNQVLCIPYTAKCLRGKTFAVFAVFHLIMNVFPRIMALLIGNVSLQAC